MVQLASEEFEAAPEAAPRPDVADMGEGQTGLAPRTILVPLSAWNFYRPAGRPDKDSGWTSV
jgi:hypothetical protein